MSDELVTVPTDYRARFSVKRLSMPPELASATHAFEFKNHKIKLSLPKIPENELPADGDAHISEWRNNTVFAISINVVYLTIEGLSFEIPEAAAVYHSVNASFYNDKQRDKLGAHGVEIGRPYWVGRPNVWAR